MWKWRNDWIFNGSALFLDNKFCQIKSFLCLNDTVCDESCVVKSHKVILVSRSPPLEGWMELNTHGTSRGNPDYGGGGGILCDNIGF